MLEKGDGPERIMAIVCLCAQLDIQPFRPQDVEKYLDGQVLRTLPATSRRCLSARGTTQSAEALAKAVMTAQKPVSVSLPTQLQMQVAHGRGQRPVHFEPPRTAHCASTT